ncbi:hypothetical protein NM688_g4180 [Phlebia brevispora]|uniref:Uncharacterized protein n=1 Tax=Phlebia brevispora TaxID=194682 RepID=A0ACC1T3L9_9APHY|nr:hypothetical protein NM688_g4180 [Phlebia brevispora]
MVNVVAVSAVVLTFRLPSTMLLYWILTTVTVRWLAYTARGQTSDVACRPPYEWMYNSLNQSPCLVAAYAQGACTTNGENEEWNVPAITNSTQTYGGPDADQASLCTCSSVTFNLISACAYCQGDGLPVWTDWTENCPANLVSNGQYPVPIESGTAIPAWAYQVVLNRFNVTIAQNDISSGFPESTASQGTSTSISFSTSASTLFSASTSSPSAPAPITSGIPATPSSGSTLPPGSPSPTSHSSHTGAIVGGAVGGAAGALLILAGVYIALRRPRAQPSSENPPQEATFREAFVVQLESSPAVTLPVSEPPMTPMKLYDPDDPSTFPPNIPDLPHGHAPGVHSPQYY